MTCIDVNDVRVSLFRPERGIAVPAAEFLYIPLTHAARLAWSAYDARLVRWADGRHPGKQVLGTHTVVSKLHTGQRAMTVNRVDHQPQTLGVVVVP